MTYATIMVHLDAGGSNAPVLDIVATLAERHRARVIGVASCRPMQIGVSDGYFTGDYSVLERDLVGEYLQQARTDFESCSALAHLVLEWRSIPTMGNIAHVVANEARSSDLVVVGASAGTDRSWTRADVGELILRAGRPVLVVPDAPAPHVFGRIMVAWKDTGECRRAIADAVPLLREADRIVVVGVATDADEAKGQVDDVIRWLARKGIDADRIVAQPEGGSIDRLAAIAVEEDADLLVAGAYGHGRIREWTFGGMTRDLLLRESRCVLLSH